MFEELEQSELGTQEYWKKVYETEVKNFRNHGDIGEVWFGEDIADRIVKWNEDNIQKSNRILDVGCGNGMLLVQLSRAGYTNLNGIDYSGDAITLAKEVSSHYQADINYSVGDILRDGICNSYDVILDKGTYDAISLSKDAQKERSLYITNIHKHLTDNGVLVITSCNWTKEELTLQFDTHFYLHDVIPTPQFKFGGSIGSVVSCIIFKKK
ncbi:hypothetical protein PPYR_14452 [Photinus pyralis]|uniref:Protein-lysine N-methyltransferase PPYR_14452 n=1 Tax=Photinus pyralis TaxID=7054 RepID=A0A1Y1MYF7_PHOPY|nr:EEF1A lysine methyltransferase 2 [Photinus pyralis]KAB0792493.1 hypothetical protein PPYR_14452 [Photinus pyralis]